MDYDFRRPRYRTAVARSLAPSFATGGQQYVESSAISTGTTPVMAEVPAHAVQVPSVSQPRRFDFASGASAYRKLVFRQSIAQGVLIGVYILAGFGLLLAAAGVYVNHHYGGRALPFTYVGDVSIGGLNEAQIKQVVADKVSDMQISFIDGGLTRSVPLSRFSITVDATAIAHQATHSRFNPFAYLNTHRYDAAVSVNERQVDGYIASTINSAKTESVNAKLAVQKKKLFIVPETLGFQTDPQFINDRIKVALTALSAPVINVNRVSLKPAVFSTDLEDDLARANTLLATPVALQYGKTVLKPTMDDKLAWLQIDQPAGSDDVNLSFSKSLIRQYVITQANKFQASSGASSPNADTAVATTQKGTVIDNIDEAADGLVAALNSGKQTTQLLTSKIGTYNKLVTTSTP